jgi:hypothetical protein
LLSHLIQPGTPHPPVRSSPRRPPPPSSFWHVPYSIPRFQRPGCLFLMKWPIPRNGMKGDCSFCLPFLRLSKTRFVIRT